MMWIVMTASAQMPASCRGNYRKVAMVKLTKAGAEAHKGGWIPPKIDARHHGVEKIEQCGSHNVGKTERGAYQRILAQAKAEVAKRNGDAS